MSEHIRWQDEPIGSIGGYVGTLDEWAFQIWRPDPMASGEWVLTSALTGQHLERRYSDDPESLKPEAEKLLTAFGASLGAIFPDSTP